MSTRFYASLLLLFLLLFSHAVQAHDAPDEEHGDVEPHSALRLTGEQTFIDLGTLFDRAQHHFTIKLINIDKKAVSVQSVRSTCPCLVIKTNPAPLTLQPGAEMEIETILRAAALSSGSFSRIIMVGLDDLPPVYVKVTGVIDNNVTFDPAPIIDLGNFAGTSVSWQRTIKMQFKFPEDKQIQLQEPEDNDKFKLTLSSPEANTFVLTATPKLPLEPGRLNEVVRLSATGVENYGPVHVALRGNVIGWNVTLKERSVTIETGKTELGKPHTAMLTVIPTSKAENKNTNRRRFSSFARPERKDGRIAEQYVEKDEQDDPTMEKIETWQAIAEKVKPTMPAGCSWEMIPQAEELQIKLIFPPDFFRQRKRFPGTVQLDERLLGRITIIGKE